MIIPAAAYRRGLNRGDPSPFYTPALARSKTVQSFLDSSDNLDQYNQLPTTVDPKFDWASKALQAGADADKLVGESSQNAVANQLAIQAKQLKRAQRGQPTGNVLAPPPGRIGSLLRALGAQESGNNPSAVNKNSGALGQWQVMPSNVSSWSKQALGHAITTQQFLNNPKLQKKVVKNIFGDYVKKYGPRGALAAWYSGDPGRANDKSPVNNGPSVYEYVNSVLSKLK